MICLAPSRVEASKGIIPKRVIIQFGLTVDLRSMIKQRLDLTIPVNIPITAEDRVTAKGNQLLNVKNIKFPLNSIAYDCRIAYIFLKCSCNDAKTRVNSERWAKPK